MGLIFYIIPYFLFFDKEKQTLTYLKKYFIISTNNARLAQLVRASRLHREGQGFESLGVHKHPAFIIQGRDFIL